MYRYGVYGVSLHSDLPLHYPALRTPGGPPDVAIRRVGAPALHSLLNGTTPRATATWCEHAALADGSTYLRCPDLADFVLSADGRQILYCAATGVSAESWQTYLLGQVISFALVTQGIEPLHATAVIVDGRAIAFLGESGQGKSTLAAAFVRHGHRLLTDDLLVLSADRAGVLAHPGPGRIKLFPKEARRLLGSGAAGVPMNALTAKLVIPLEPSQVQDATVPLGALYVLRSPERPADARAIRVSALRSRDAFLQLMKHTFNRIVVAPERLERQFESAARLASRVPIRRLSYTRGLARLPGVRDAVLADLTRLRA